jgi:hypothetical protein
MSYLLQHSGELRRSACDLVQISSLDEVGRAQIRTGVDGKASGRDELLGAIFVDAAGGDELHVRIRPLEIFDVSGPTEIRREELHRVAPRLDRICHLARRERSEEYRNPCVLADLGEVPTQRWRDDEGRPGVDRSSSLIGSEHGPCSDVGIAADGGSDRVEHVGDGEGQFDAMHAASCECIGEAARVGDLLRAHDGNDPIGAHDRDDVNHRHRH